MFHVKISPVGTQDSPFVTVTTDIFGQTRIVMELPAGHTFDYAAASLTPSQVEEFVNALTKHAVVKES